ncbi:MAG: FHA domain-containing protein [Blastocatellia bacterium]|nr:FHA domain-containing protein [Blastocatellia bacterium]
MVSTSLYDMMEAVLTIHSPEGTRKVPMTQDRLTLGRGEDADVCIDDAGLSRLHASIYREDEKVWILDEGSTNGSYVNGAPVLLRGTPLADGDKISIGDYTTVWISLSHPSSAVSRQPSAVSHQPSAVSNHKSAIRNPPTADRESILFRLPTAAVAVMAAALLIGVVMLAVNLLKGSVETSGDVNEESAYRTHEPGASDSRSKEDQAYGPSSNGTAVGDPTSNTNAAGGSDTSVVQYPDREGGGSNSTAGAPLAAGSRKLYLQMTEAERNEFIYDRARHISRMMGNREYQFTADVLPYIKRYVDAYARRVGNKSTSLWSEDLNLLFGRARRVAPHIIRSFNAHGVPSVVGLYIPMIESEYRECLTSPVGAKGLFQFMPDTARGYGVDPADRCDARKMAPAAAMYMKHRIAEFGTDAMSVALGIAGYNRSPDSVRRDLHDVLDSENKERSFWTLIANSNKLDRYFQNENVKYVPKFFAAAIVGETPWAFGLEMNPLTTYTRNTDGE